MWPTIEPINLIRYLFVWRVNRALVRMPKCLSTEMSLALGTMIANRLPTQEAHQWRKALAPWEEVQAKISDKTKRESPPVPEAAWPIKTVLFAYPGKRNYGQGELILWELKLMGEDADHRLFLEVILPAIEEASNTSDPPWYRQHSLWGRFDVHAVYAARGSHWEPVVSDGRLDLSYRPDHTQWAEGSTFGANSERLFKRLTWLTPFDLATGSNEASDLSGQSSQEEIPPHEIPTLPGLLDALIARIAVLLPGKRNTPGDVWNALKPEAQSSLQEAIDRVYHLPVRKTELKPAPRDWPGRWIGAQTFPRIPPLVIPYLELASILHIGRQTHFGCGTFTLT